MSVMATIRSCLLLLSVIYLLISLAFAQLGINDYLKREHSLMRPYQGAGMMIPNWDFIGSTIVTGSYVRLTPDQQSKQGALWNNVPCFIPNWEIQIHFKVHGHGKDLFGDGFAIWYAKEPLQLGPVFGSKDYFSGLSVFVDTYANQNGPHDHSHPYISATVNNGTLHYDHDRDGTHTEVAGCEAKFRGDGYDPRLSIRYVGTTLSVLTDIDGKNEWTECFKADGIRLPIGYYFGVSAATGDLSDNHDIIHFKVFELEGPPIEEKDAIDRLNISPSAEKSAAPRDHVEDIPPTSGAKILLIVVCVIAGLVICLIGGILYIQKQETSRKRLY